MSFFVGLFGLSLAVAQAPNQECLTNLSIFVESAKVKNYDAAYEPWKMVYETSGSGSLSILSLNS